MEIIIYYVKGIIVMEIIISINIGIMGAQWKTFLEFLSTILAFCARGFRSPKSDPNVAMRRQPLGRLYA